MKISTDKAILASGIRNGNRRIFSEFYLLTNKKVYGQALKFGLDHEDAEEVVQEVFLSIWRNRMQLKLDLSIDAYLYKVAQSFIFKVFRRKAYQIAYENFKKNENFDGVFNGVSEILEYKELDEILHQLIDEMPAKRKEIFQLSRLEYLSHQDIASRLNVSVRTVESQIYKAVKYLKGRFLEMEL